MPAGDIVGLLCVGAAFAVLLGVAALAIWYAKRDEDYD